MLQVTELTEPYAESSPSQAERERMERELREKELQELMAMLRRNQHETAEAARVLGAVREGDLSPLAPYTRPLPDGRCMLLNAEDEARERQIIAQGHLRNEIFGIVVRDGRDPAAALDIHKKWLKETFPATPTDAMLVRLDDGTIGVLSMGILPTEAAAALRLQVQQGQAKEESELAARLIREKASGLESTDSREVPIPSASPQRAASFQPASPAHRR